MTLSLCVMIVVSIRLICFAAGRGTKQTVASGWGHDVFRALKPCILLYYFSSFFANHYSVY